MTILMITLLAQIGMQPTDPVPYLPVKPKQELEWILSFPGMRIKPIGPFETEKECLQAKDKYSWLDIEKVCLSRKYLGPRLEFKD